MASGLAFQCGEWLLDIADFLAPGFPHVVLLLTVSMEEAEEMPDTAGNLLKLPLQLALCTVCGEKSDGIHSNQSTPIASVVACASLEGPDSRMHDLPCVHSEENACGF